MRRWNGWGDDTLSYAVPENARQLLTMLVGEGSPPKDAALDAVLAAIPASPLPHHPLVDTGLAERLLHARGQSFPDWLALRSGQVGCFPAGVAYPEDSDQIRDLIRFSLDNQISLIPYGGGTSVVGHVNPLAGQPAISVDMRRMSRLHHFDERSLLATFGAGVSGPDLEAQLRARGCTLGHFPQSFEYSTLGGWIATRSSGQQSLRYGRIERLFAGGRLESPAGGLDLPVFPASAAGPDLRELILGSEGRIGILTEATVRASLLPEREEFHAVFFPDFDHGQQAVRSMLQAGLPLSMLRLSTATETMTTLALAGHTALISSLEALLRLRNVGDEKSMLMIGFSGPSRIVSASRHAAHDIAARAGGVWVGEAFGHQWHKSRFRTPYLRNSLWEMGYGVDTLETATTWEDAPQMLADIDLALRQAMEAYNERVHVFTHLSHLYPYGTSVYTTYLFRVAADPEVTLKRWQALKEAASLVIVAHRGTISHQHGVGIDHAKYLPSEKGSLGMDSLRAAITVFDPAGLMNPGKLLL